MQETISYEDLIAKPLAPPPYDPLDSEAYRTIRVLGLTIVSYNKHAMQQFLSKFRLRRTGPRKQQRRNLDISGIEEMRCKLDIMAIRFNRLEIDIRDSMAQLVTIEENSRGQIVVVEEDSEALVAVPNQEVRAQRRRSV